MESTGHNGQPRWGSRCRPRKRSTCNSNRRLEGHTQDRLAENPYLRDLTLELCRQLANIARCKDGPSLNEGVILVMAALRHHSRPTRTDHSHSQAHPGNRCTHLLRRPINKLQQTLSGMPHIIHTWHAPPLRGVWFPIVMKTAPCL
jgi:hypothetical protein